GAAQRGRSASAALVAERGKARIDPAAVNHGPGDQARNPEKDAGIGAHDEAGMLAQFDHALSPRAALRSSVIRRRRLTSVCMAVSCRVMKRKVKAKNMTKSGVRIEPGMV